jgi:hypothetical protein
VPPKIKPRSGIYAIEQRAVAHSAFTKYCSWLKEAALYDGSLVAHDHARIAELQYDAAVVDEVQDLTNAELALVLAPPRCATPFCSVAMPIRSVIRTSLRGRRRGGSVRIGTPCWLAVRLARPIAPRDNSGAASGSVTICPATSACAWLLRRANPSAIPRYLSCCASTSWTLARSPATPHEV